jgi:uncharacterized protein YifN (PemK superfamily)
MIDKYNAFSSIPDGLRDPLIEEYSTLINNFMENRWRPTELSGGRFCEIVFTIIKGYSTGSYPSNPSKPRNMVDACRLLEQNSHVPRSFQILIPRLLPALYEFRNNRNVGHVGGDVNPDFMDSNAVVSISSWIMAELIRVLHNTTTEEAQLCIDNIVETKSVLIWKSGNIKRILKTDLSLKDNILILLYSNSGKSSSTELKNWTECKNNSYFMRILRELHSKRFIEFNEVNDDITLLPPGSTYVSNLLMKLKNA